MSGHTPRDLILHGAVPLEARKIWARLPKGRGHAGLSLWPVGPLNRTGPLPLEDLPGSFQRTFCKHSCRLFRKPRTLLPSPGEKCYWVVTSQGPWP